MYQRGVIDVGTFHRNKALESCANGMVSFFERRRSSHYRCAVGIQETEIVSIGTLESLDTRQNKKTPHGSNPRFTTENNSTHQYAPEIPSDEFLFSPAIPSFWYGQRAAEAAFHISPTVTIRKHEARRRKIDAFSLAARSNTVGDNARTTSTHSSRA